MISEQPEEPKMIRIQSPGVLFILLLVLVAAVCGLLPAQSSQSSQAPQAGSRSQARPKRTHVLAWADIRNGFQHESVSNAVAAIERLGYESGLYDTYIRTDSQL